MQFNEHTYSNPADRRRLDDLAGRIADDAHAIAQLADWCHAVKNSPGVTPEFEPVATGRRATAGATRPTEGVALDERRLKICTELRTAENHLLHAAAYTAGVKAALDRVLDAREGRANVSHGRTSEHAA
ncbi:hypothetical protein AB0L99_42890 [Streptomyces sp. NPDC051954]|uniref:DUF7169 domain-containing protein n=1 Tax=Streptomyces sp. NPDC051954 TaxID=3155524 RepID=UPI00344A6AFA